MITKLETDKLNRLTFFQSLCEKAKNAKGEVEEEQTRALEQYNGSKAIDGSHEEAQVVRNITYELIESEVSTYIPRSVVTAEVYSERNERCAKSIEMLCNRLRNKLPLEVLNDIDERACYIFGSSVWLVEWDESIRTATTVGDVSLRVISPQDFYPQPGIDSIDDMDYCFIKYNASVDDVSRTYGVDVSVAEQGESEEHSDDDDIITVYICYFKDEDGNVCKYVWSDDVELQDIEDYYARKVRYCKKCGQREELCKCENTTDKDYESMDAEYEEIDEDIVTANNGVIHSESIKYKNGKPVVKDVETPVLDAYGTPVLAADGLPVTETVQTYALHKTKIPYFKPKRLPVVLRRNTAKLGSLWGESDCTRIRPQQQAINKVESRIMQKLMRAGITPVMPEDASIAMNNAVFGNVIKMAPGQNKSDYGIIDTTPNIAQDVAEADRLYDQAKRILGISDSFQGQYDGSAQSGYAKQLQISQSSGRLQSKRALKHALYADLDRIIFELYLAFADEERHMPYKDELGRMQDVKFSRYDFVRLDEAGNYYYSDRFLFEADASIDPEENREQLWEINLNNLKTGTYGNPADPATMVRYWSAQEKAHYPNARENVEYFQQLYQQMLKAQMQAQQAQMPQGNLIPQGGQNI